MPRLTPWISTRSLPERQTGTPQHRWSRCGPPVSFATGATVPETLKRPASEGTGWGEYPSKRPRLGLGRPTKPRYLSSHVLPWGVPNDGVSAVWKR